MKVKLLKLANYGFLMLVALFFLGTAINGLMQVFLLRTFVGVQIFAGGMFFSLVIYILLEETAG